MKRKIPLSWFQLTRIPSRLLVAMTGIAFADFLMFIQIGFESALYKSNTLIHESLKADLVLMSPQAQNIGNMETFPRRRLSQAMNFEGVSSAQPFYSEVGNWKNPENQQQAELLFFAFNPAQSVLNLPGIEQNLEKLKLTDTIIFDRFSDGEYDTTLERLENGEEITTEIEQRQVTVAGLFSLGASFAGDSNAIVSDLTLLRLFPGKNLSEVNAGLIQLKPNIDPQQMAKILEANLPNDVKVLTLEEFIDFEKKYWSDSTPIGFIFAIGTGIGFLVGLVIVYQILYADVSDHLPEYATLKAMGYSDTYFLGVVLQEAVILAVLGFLPGFAISVGLYQLAQGATLLPIVMTTRRAVLILLATIVMCTLSGTLALRKLSAADPAEIF